jgi:uncharacterized protein
MHRAYSRILSMLIVVLSTGGVARADMLSAETAYAKQDFPAAFAQFKELAELGKPEAQYDLAVMYAQGQGVETSYTYAHAWASLSSANGFAKATDLASRLEPELTPGSLRISADIQAQYSQKALNARLLPNIFQGRVYETHDPVAPYKPFMPSYPRAAQMRGAQGEVFVEFTVAPDGHARLPRVLYAIPSGYFEEAVWDGVMRSVFLPARINGVPIASEVATFYRFVVENASLADYSNLQSRVEDEKKKAESGDPAAQMLYGMMLAGLPQLKQSYDRALPWFLKAAQAGAPYAQYQIGTALMQGRGCQCDERKGEIWLEKAAQADQADAQVTLAQYLLKDTANPQSLAGALVWLNRAAEHGNSSGKLMLAAVLAASPATHVIDPARALSLIDSLGHPYREDPSLWEIRAAANASRGSFDAAIKSQSEALTKATELGWDLTPLKQRMALYTAHQAWSGDLLAF